MFLGIDCINKHQERQTAGPTLVLSGGVIIFNKGS